MGCPYFRADWLTWKISLSHESSRSSYLWVGSAVRTYIVGIEGTHSTQTICFCSNSFLRRIGNSVLFPLTAGLSRNQ